MVAQSIVKTKYISLATTTNQIIWLKKVLVNLAQEHSSPTGLFYDNKFVIAIAYNPVQHGRTKHINVKFHATREVKRNLFITIHFCSTKVQLEDLMTKALPLARLEFLKMKLGLYKANLKEECLSNDVLKMIV